MELKEFKALLEEFEQVSKRWRPVSPWWWLIPPLKVHKERVRGNNILRVAADTKRERRQAVNFLDKATAWYFVALAGWLKMITFTYELMGAVRGRKRLDYGRTGDHSDIWWHLQRPLSDRLQAGGQKEAELDSGPERVQA